MTATAVPPRPFTPALVHQLAVEPEAVRTYLVDRLTFATASLVAFRATLGADQHPTRTVARRGRLVHAFARDALADHTAYLTATGQPSPAPALAAALAQLHERPTCRIAYRQAQHALANRLNTMAGGVS